MAKAKNHEGEEQTWAEYLAEIEKPEKQEKKGQGIGSALRELLQKIGLDGKGKTGSEEIKKQVAISAGEARESKQKALAEKQPVKGQPLDTDSGKKQAIGQAALEKPAGAESGMPKPAADFYDEEKAEPKKTVLEKAPLEKAETRGSFEKYLEKVEEKKKAVEKQRSLEEFGKMLEEEKSKKLEGEKTATPEKAGAAKEGVLEKAASEKLLLPMARADQSTQEKPAEKAVEKKPLPPLAKAGEKAPEKPITKAVEKSPEKPAAKEGEKTKFSFPRMFFPQKKVLPEKEETLVVEKKIALLPKAEKAPVSKKAVGKKTGLAKGRKAKGKKQAAAAKKGVVEKKRGAKPFFKKGKGIVKAAGPLKGAKTTIAEKKQAAAKKGVVEKEAVVAGGMQKGSENMPGAKGGALLFGKGLSLATKSVEEIKKISPDEIKKEFERELIEDKARGWYGDALRHKKAAVSGWRLRKRVRLHQLRKKQKQKRLTGREKKTMKALIADDRGLREKISALDKQIRSLHRIASEKKKENRELEKKIKAVGVALPGRAEAGENRLKKGDMQQLVESMKKIADEMATAATREPAVDIESEEAMPIDDRIKAQENMIKNLERAFYKRKIDFNQFREKMFDYQSKLTEMKIRKKINEERIENMPPEMKRAMERRIAAGEVGKGVGIPSKTAEAIEKIAEERTGGKEAGTEALEAIRKIAEKQAAQPEKEAEEKKFAEKTASILERISERLASSQAGGANAAAGGTIGKETAGPLSKWQQKQEKSYQGGAGRAKEYGGAKETQAKPPAGERETQAQPQTGGTKQAPEGTKQQADYKQGTTGQKGALGTGTQKQGSSQQAANINVNYGPGTGLAAQPKKPSGLEGKMPQPAADFYEEEKAAKPKKGFFRRLRGKEPERKAARQPVGEEVDRAIREKAAHAGISREQVDRVEEKLGDLLRKYRIPDNAVASHINSLDETRLIDSFEKLIGIIEDRRENAVDELIKPAPGFDINSGIISQKKEKIEGTEKEIKMARIETSFDKVLALVQVKGVINLNDTAAQLKMPKNEVQQCAEILERSKLINLSYPPIGPVKLIYPAYLKWKAEEKKKEAEEKKKNKGKKVG